MHGMDDEVNMRRFGALRAAMPVTFVTFLIGYLAIIGIRRSPASSPRTSSSRRRSPTTSGSVSPPSSARDHGLLHDARHDPDVLRRQALEGGRPPARVTDVDEGADGAALGRIGGARFVLWSGDRIVNWLEPVVGPEEHHELGIPVWAVTLIILTVVLVASRSPWPCTSDVRFRSRRRPVRC